ncbi:hypothetical protein AK88_03633 [Plasmodium fragile]|uniref:Uncharacterized protein n=1 Tax=Plasmodium fragile TaxID=5857 RepID=A0A0D9QLX7_PLAFR|nr:uncharacterized protein AK88_03633 [Plasmodium fragile]KJP86721.1 hypothetical protein AK88_03633 [Plasmodium fragile]
MAERNLTTPGLTDGSPTSTLITLLESAVSNMNISSSPTTSTAMSTPFSSPFRGELPTDAPNNIAFHGLLANTTTQPSVSLLEDIVTSATTGAQNFVRDAINTTVGTNVSTLGEVLTESANYTMSTLRDMVENGTATTINTTSPSYMNITTNETRIPHHSFNFYLPLWITTMVLISVAIWMAIIILNICEISNNKKSEEVQLNDMLRRLHADYQNMSNAQRRRRRGRPYHESLYTVEEGGSDESDDED